MILECQTELVNKWYFHGNNETRQISYGGKILTEFKDKYSIDGTYNLVIPFANFSNAGRYECVVDDDNCTPRGSNIHLGLGNIIT